MKKILLLLSLVLMGCGGSQVQTVEELEQILQEEVFWDENAADVDGEYLSEEFGFAAKILPDYEVAYLPERRGFRLTKNFNIYDEKLKMDLGHVVTFDVTVSSNLQGWKDIYSMVGERYRGFTTEFRATEWGDGVIIDEGLGEYAVKKYILFDDRADSIYEISLRGESNLVINFYEDFEKLVDSLRLL